MRLTELSRAAGCAGKLAPQDLDRAIRPIPRQNYPEVLVGYENSDDAGVYQLTPDVALVQTSTSSALSSMTLIPMARSPGRMRSAMFMRWEVSLERRYRYWASPPAMAMNVMVELNQLASEISVDFEVDAMTDITGFGLIGHALEVAKASMVSIHINHRHLPLLPGVLIQVVHRCVA